MEEISSHNDFFVIVIYSKLECFIGFPPQKNRISTLQKLQ